MRKLFKLCINLKAAAARKLNAGFINYSMNKDQLFAGLVFLLSRLPVTVSVA